MTRATLPLIALLVFASGTALAEDEPAGTGSRRLPPPRVVSLTPGTPESSAPAAAPDWSSPAAPAGEAPMTQPAATAFPPATEPAARAATQPAARAPEHVEITDIRKTHNLDRAPDGLALKLEVDFTATGLNGKIVETIVTFADGRTGNVLKSTSGRFCDLEGNIKAWSKRGRLGQDRQEVHSALWIPYRAFPRFPGVESYPVHARVEIMGYDDAGRTALLQRGHTTFTVHATPAPIEGAPAKENRAHPATDTAIEAREREAAAEKEAGKPAAPEDDTDAPADDDGEDFSG